MGKIISCGQCSIYYILILISSVCRLTIKLMFSEEKIEGMNFYTSIGAHDLMQLIYTNFAMIVFGIILYFIERKLNYKKVTMNNFFHKRQKKIKDIDIHESSLFYVERLNDDTDEFHNEHKNQIYKALFISCFLFSLSEIGKILLRKFYLGNLYFWMINIVFILFWNKKILKWEMLRHHYFALIFCLIIPLILKIISLFLPTYIIKLGSGEIKKVGILENIYLSDGNWFIIIVGILGYLILDFAQSFSVVEFCDLMIELFVNPSQILLVLGFTGIILSIIAMLFCTFFSCSFQNEILYSVCPFTTNSDNSTYYFDSFICYHEDIKKYNNEAIELALITPLYCILSSANMFCIILAIRNLGPFIYNAGSEFYWSIIDFIFYFVETYDTKTLEEFICDELEDILSSFGYLIILELIQFSCYDLNKDLKKNIQERALLEIKESIEEIDFNSEDEKEGIFDD